MYDIKSIVESAKQGVNLSAEQAYNCINHILSGEATEVEIASLLTCLAVKGEVADEIYGAASALRAHMNKFELASDSSDIVIDNCGTGGTGISTINSSTVSAIVAACCGVKIAKHGNVTAGRKSGSANWLYTAGMPADMSPEQNQHSLQQFNFCFLFAPFWHPAMKFVGPVRKQLKFSTLFNLLGPLCNPASVKKQIIGVANQRRAELLAQAAKQFDYNLLYIIYSEDGLDDISPAAPTHIYTVKNGQVTQSVIHPSDFGFKLISIDQIIVDSPQDSYNKTVAALREQGPGFTMLAMNAGLAIHLANRDISLIQAVKIANQSLENGAAYQHLMNLNQYWQSIGSKGS